jgi:hypothetical protein
MELGIILRHDPLTLGSGCVENIEVKRGFCTELQNNCEGGGEEWIESQMQQTCHKGEAVWEKPYHCCMR